MSASLPPVPPKPPKSDYDAFLVVWRQLSVVLSETVPELLRRLAYTVDHLRT